MDLIGRGIKARRGYRRLHRYLHVAAEAREPRPSCDRAVPDQMANPETGGPVAAGSFADVGESPAPLRVVAEPGWRLTCALGILLRKMSSRAVSLARVTAVQGGGGSR
jgi:hypothetical protein